MEENNKEELELFDHVPAGANDWQVVDDHDAASHVEAETPAPTPVPQIWDDIPREDPVPAPHPEPEVQPEIQLEIQPEVQPEEAPAITVEEAAAPAPKIPAAQAIAPAANNLDAETHYRHVAPAEISTLAEMGSYLAKMRQNARLSSDEVSAATKIRGDYLAAIESGDASELPQAVYVLAYIRKLCELYSIDTANLSDFFEDLRDGFSYELPEDINKSIVGHENDEEQEKKVRQLAIGLITAAAIVIFALIIGAVTLLVTLTKENDRQACAVSDRKIMEYQGKPTLLMQKLPPIR